jgi:hypothetical protein
MSPSEEERLKHYLSLDVIHCYDPSYGPFCLPLQIK